MHTWFTSGNTSLQGELEHLVQAATAALLAEAQRQAGDGGDSPTGPAAAASANAPQVRGSGSLAIHQPRWAQL